MYVKAELSQWWCTPCEVEVGSYLSLRPGYAEKPCLKKPKKNNQNFPTTQEKQKVP